MDLVDLPRSTLISRPQSLRKLTDTLAQELILAVDTEFEQPVCLPGESVPYPVFYHKEGLSGRSTGDR